MVILYQTLLILYLVADSRSEHLVYTISSACDYQSRTCFTLKKLIQTHQSSGGGNLTLRFLPGKHILDQSLTISGYRYVELIGKDALISCGPSAMIELNQIDRLNIVSLSFSQQIGNPQTHKNFSQECLRLEKIKNIRLVDCSFTNFKITQRIVAIQQCVNVMVQQVFSEFNSGQALFVDAQYVQITNSTFSSNQNGAVNINSNSLEVTDSEFKNNTSPIGGAVYLKSSNTTILNCKFSSNSADYGGALSIHNSAKVNISHSIFSSNSAGSGGAVATESSDVTITNCTFTGNTVYMYYDYKEAIKTEKLAVTLTKNLNISYYDLKSFNPITGGGGIFIWSGVVHIFNTVFTNNSALSLEDKQSFIQGILPSTTGGTGGGAIIIYSGSLSISNCVFINNTAPNDGGGGIHIGYKLFVPHVVVTSGNVVISDTDFIQNSAYIGGAIFTWSGKVCLLKTQLFLNRAFTTGGAITVMFGSTHIIQSSIMKNSAISGGAIDSLGSLHLLQSVLAYNAAESGGALTIQRHGTISSTTINHNIALFNGGAIMFVGIELIVTDSALMNNTALQSGGALMVTSGEVYVSNSTLSYNAAVQGAAVYIQAVITINSCYISHNKATSNNGGTIYIYQSFITFLGLVEFHNNNGSIYALYTELIFSGQMKLNNNRGSLGGAITALQSQVYMNGSEEVSICNNTAISGGGIYLRDSTLYVYSPIKISHNKAFEGGGGIYAFLSSIKFKSLTNEVQKSIVSYNVANNGGGVSVIASTIEIALSYVEVHSNIAKLRGGGINLNQNSNIHLLKLNSEYTSPPSSIVIYSVKLTISSNSAKYGGGILVADETEVGGLCRATPATHDPTLSECFIQTLYLYRSMAVLVTDINGDNTFNTIMKNNKAEVSGENIYGGLMDRCTVNPLAQFHQTTNGWQYLQNTIHFNSSDSISSDPVRVIICGNSSLLLSVRKGGEFKISLMAVDQVGNPVSANIYSSVITKSSVGRLKEGQAKQPIENQCKELTYNVFSADGEAQMELYAEGPCMNSGISKTLLNISFLPCTCPTGFQPFQSPINCQCICDERLRQFQLTSEDCFYGEGTVQLRNDIWIGVVNSTNGTDYVASHCAFDYCIKRPVNISLTSGINEQCSYNRSGVLCGKCEEGLSVVLATSKCKQCSNFFLFLLIPFALAGIFLIGLILLFNMTVANGAIHGLIFYANILAANRAVLMPFNNFLTVFISWVNLDLGIETCLYNGMTSQAKVLLQLVFPTYLFLLIFLIITLCKHFQSFSKLLSNRNPVAALGTLILISYGKLLRFIIAGLQYVVLSYPSGTNRTVWLYDGNVEYFSAVHTPRFVAAAIILIAGGLFTITLFFGQWFPLCSKWKIMKWTKNTRYNGFMDVYHAPFTPKHRYWLGLLLFALIVHNIVVAMAPNTSLPVLSTGCISVGMLVFKLISSRIYKSKFISHLETLFLLNLAILCYGTFFVKDGPSEQAILSSISLSIAFIKFIAIIIYHFQRFNLKITCRGMLCQTIINLLNKCSRKFTAQQLIPEENGNNLLLEGNDDIDEQFEHRYHEPAVDPPMIEADYITPPIIRPALRPDHLRLSYMDDLAPVTEDDYRQVIPLAPHHCPVVTHTELEMVNHKLLV